MVLAFVTDLLVVRPVAIGVLLVLVAVLDALAFLFSGGGFSLAGETGGERSMSSTIGRFRLPTLGALVGAIAEIFGGGAALASTAGLLPFDVDEIGLEREEDSISLSYPIAGVAGRDMVLMPPDQGEACRLSCEGLGEFAADVSLPPSSLFFALVTESSARGLLRWCSNLVMDASRSNT